VLLVVAFLVSCGAAVFVTHTSRTKSTGFGQRIGLTDTNRRRNGSYRRNQEAD
jgi:hypothetical protein